MSCGDRIIGWIVGESTPSRSSMILNEVGNKIAKRGLFVSAEADGECIIGILEKIVSGNPFLPEEIANSKEVEVLTSFEEIKERLYKRGYIRWLSKLYSLADKGKVETPRVPVDPSTPVYTVDRYYLGKIFKGEGKSWIELGSLISDPSVRVSIDTNKLARHLAILAVTGGGKSNAVCVISKRVVENLKGTVVIFDIHGEYARAGITEPKRQKVIEPKIHPSKLSFSELLKLMRMPPNATNQERVLREAWYEALKELQEKNIPKGLVFKTLRDKVARRKSSDQKTAANAVLNRIDDLIENYGDVLDENTLTSLINIIEPGKLNIFDLSSVDENGADAVVGHYLRRLLQERKIWKTSGGQEGYPSPVIVVIEEAHVLIPKDSSTITKYWASRVAREGRKFGVGLVLVSQRPKGLDPNVLSQTNNKIILRIVEPSDQRYVREASEQLSEDLMELLPDLNPGEAVVIGSMVRVPTLVKIDLCSNLSLGADIDMVAEWENLDKNRLSIEEIRDLLT